MRILITGAAGYFCQEAIAQLEPKGHMLRLSDIMRMRTKHEFVKCDILNPNDLMIAMKDIDVVFHTVIGSGGGAPDTPSDRVQAASKSFAVMVMGTFNVLQAAAAMGVTKVVMIGSEAARGQRIPITFTDVCDEETPAKPDYVYALGKYVMEVLAEYAARIDNVKTVVLRNAWFGDAGGKDLAKMATTLLHQRSVTRRDLARAAVLAIENADVEHEVLLLSNATDFTKEDVPMLRTNPEQVIEKYYPGAVALLGEYGVDLTALYESKDLWKIDDISRAKRVLGWEPTFTFRDLYENLKAGQYSSDSLFVEETTWTRGSKARPVRIRR